MSFGINVLLTRALGAERFGHLALLLTASHLVSVLCANWSAAALVRFGARDHAAGRTVAEAVWTRGVLVVVAFSAMGVTAAALREPLGAFLGMSADLVWLVPAHAAATSIFLTAGGILQATDRLRAYGAALAVERALALIVVGFLLAAGSRSVVIVLASFAMSALLGTAAAMALARISLIPARVSRSLLVDMWRFSLPLIVSTWAGFFGSQWIDYIFVRGALSLNDLGQYALAYQVTGVVQQVTVIASTMLLPRYSLVTSDAGDRELQWLIGRVVPYWLLCASTGIAIAVLFAEPLTLTLFGHGYEAAITPLRILLLATVALAVLNTITPLLIAWGRTWAVTRMVLVAAAVNVLLDAVLVQPAGTIGVALASLGSYAVSLLLILVLPEVRAVMPAARYALFCTPVAVVYLWTLALSGPALVLVSALSIMALLVLLIRIFGLFATSEAAIPRARASRREP